MTGPIVDIHTHVMPRALLTWLARRGLADIDDLGRGIVRLAPSVSGLTAGTPIPCPVEQVDAEARLAAMDEAGVDRHLISVPPFLLCARADDRRLAAEIVAAGNDALTEFAATASARMSVLGSVPLGSPRAADEAQRCLDDLAAAGIALGTRGGIVDLDADMHEPLWEMLGQRRAFCLLHPSTAPDPDRVRDHWLTQLVGFPVETAIAVARLLFSGVLDRHDPVLCLAHGGGALPALRARLDVGWERKDAARSTPRRPTHYLDRLYYDTAVFSATAISRLVEDVGAEHVLYGTDTPFDLADVDGLAATARLDDAQATLIRGANALALLDL